LARTSGFAGISIGIGESVLLLRPIGNTVYFMPPYVISDDELQWVVKVAGEAVDEATSAPAVGGEVGVSLPWDKS
jgi:acetylornithine/succinyldiaminopimelate/putrescine aminotransferase